MKLVIDMVVALLAANGAAGLPVIYGQPTWFRLVVAMVVFLMLAKRACREYLIMGFLEGIHR